MLQLRQQDVREVAGGMAVCTGIQPAVVEVGGINAESAYNLVFLAEAGIAVQGHTHFKGDAQAFFRRIEY